MSDKPPSLMPLMAPLLDLLKQALTSFQAVMFPRLPKQAEKAPPKLDRLANISGPVAGIPPGANLVCWTEKFSAQLAAAANSGTSLTIQTKDKICIVGIRVMGAGSANFQAVPGAVLTATWNGSNGGSPFPTGEGLPCDLLFTSPEGGPWICPIGPLIHTAKGSTDSVQFTVTRKIAAAVAEDVYITFVGYSTE